MTSLDGFLALAAAHQVAVLATLAFLVLLIILLMAIAVIRARRAAGPAAPEPADGGADLELVPVKVEDGTPQAKTAPTTAGTLKHVRRLLKEGWAAYRETLARNPYLVPWVLRTGVDGQDDGGLLAALDDTRPPVGDARTDGLSWHIYDRGIIIDVAEPAHWAEVLGFVARRRSALPIDGIVLTVPVSALTDVRRAGAKGAEAYTRLWTAQRQLGFAVPVYVVITGTEALDGFRTFQAMLPEAHRDGIIGWSFPYALETAFSPEYVGEALQTVDEAMLAATLEAFGAVLESEQGGLLLRTREELAAMEEPLRQFLATALRRTAYQESLYFRGLYFITRPDPEAPASFVRDLIERKVFPEYGLSKLLRGAARSRLLRRYAWPAGVAAAALLAVLTIGVSLSRVGNYQAMVVPVLQSTAADIEAISAQRPSANGDADAAAYADAAVRYLRNVGLLARSEPLVFVPLTWLGSDPYGVQQAMRAGWQHIVLGATKRLIEQRLAGLAQPDAQSATPEAAFVGFMTRVAEAEGFARAFNDIGRGTSNVPIRDLLQYALQVSIPRTTMDKLESWGAVGSGAQPIDDPTLRIDLPHYRDATVAVFKQLGDAYFRQLAAGGQVGARLSVVATELGFLASGRRSAADAAQSFEEVQLGLDAAARLLNGSQPSWIGASTALIPPTVQPLLDSATTSLLLGPEARDQVLQLARQRFDEVRNQVGAVDSVIGPLVKRNGNSTADLTSTAEQLRQLIAQWQRRRFMRPVPAATSGQSVAAGYGWDGVALEAVPPLFEDYLLFEAKELPQAPELLRPAMRAAAQYYLQKSVEAALQRASTPLGANGVERQASLTVLRDWASSLRTSFPVLEQTIQTFMQLGMPQPAEALRQRVASQAGALLRRVDGIVESDQLYRPSSVYLASWRGGPIDAAGLFGQTSPGALAQMLVSSRLEMATLARQIASPMIEVLSRPVMQSVEAYPLANRWLHIVSALDQYDGSRPNSSLALLEKFITDEVPKIDGHACLAIQVPTVATDDYFSDRLAQLKSTLLHRCVDLADEQLMAGYGQLMHFFNERLAGRVPFDAGVGQAPSASLADVRDFYTLLDAHDADVVKPLAVVSLSRPQWRGAEQFVHTMAAARPLLTLVANPPPNVQLQVVPHFRVNRAYELAADNIIEWKLSIAGQQQTNFAAPKIPLSWLSDDPVTLALRWAKDGPVQPVQGIGSGAQKIDGMTASFHLEGPWSLVALLREHHPGPGERGRLVGARGVLAGFEVRTTPRLEKAMVAVKGGQPVALPTPLQTATARARAYMTFDLMQISEADGRRKADELALPDLPTAAPEPLVTSGISLTGATALPGGVPGGVPGATFRPASIDRALLDLIGPGAPNDPAAVQPLAAPQ